MSTDRITWPEKTRDLHNHHVDSTVWDDFVFRDDDIIIGTYCKSGTTWVQQIVSQLIFDAQPGLEVAEMSPWVDLRVPPRQVKLPALEAQSHRRCVKTHLPVDALVYSPRAKYLYIARDGRDVVWSLYNHHANANDAWYAALNDTPGRVGPAIERPVDDIRQYFLEWLENDGYPFWSYWDNVQSWFDIRHLPNLMLLHFSELKRDMAGQIRRIAGFLDIAIDESKWPAILEHCSFAYMKQNATKAVPLGGAFWDGGATTFIYKGVNGRWRDTLTDEDVARYEAIARDRLSPACFRWVTEGELAPGE